MNISNKLKGYINIFLLTITSLMLLGLIRPHKYLANLRKVYILYVIKLIRY